MLCLCLCANGVEVKDGICVFLPGYERKKNSNRHMYTHLHTHTHKTVQLFAMPEPKSTGFNDEQEEKRILNITFNLILHFHEPVPHPQIMLRCLES